jgi:phosphoribosyl-ATP pyrophosphohydrolase
VKTFEELYSELQAKVAMNDPASSTARLVGAGVHAVGKKVVEEAAEAWMAAEHESRERAADEIAQLIYHAQVLMLASGVTLRDVYERL